MGSTTDKIKGAVMKVEGKLTGDPVRKAQGQAMSSKGKVAGALEKAGQKIKSAVRDVKARASTARTRTRAR